MASFRAFLVILCPLIFSYSSAFVDTTTNKLENLAPVFTNLYHKLMINQANAVKYGASPTTPESDSLLALYHLINKGKVKYEFATSPRVRNLYKTLMAGRNRDFVMYYRPNETPIGRKMLLLFTNQGSASTRFLLKQPANAIQLSEQICKYAGRPHMSCVQSFEAMVDAMVKRMGPNITMLSTPPGKGQYYKVSSSVEIIRTAHSVVTVCHNQQFNPFAVYICHTLPRSQVRLVPLVGVEDGIKLNAVSICHMDTSSWNSNFHALVLLNTTAGPPLCHFMATDDLVWINTVPA